MYLILNEPKQGDLVQFMELIQDNDIINEFLYLKNLDLSQADSFLKRWIDINSKGSTSWLNFIRLGDEYSENYDSSNSKIIGFISLNRTNMSEQILTGYNDLLNFGISREFRNRKLMTTSLKMKMERLQFHGYNLIPALVKNGNYASEKILLNVGFELSENLPVGKLFIYRFKKF